MSKLPLGLDGFNDESEKAKQRPLPINLKPHKTVWLAVSDDVLLNELEMQIIDTEEFQRLRKIRQLGTTHVVFPTATHTRFDHALGTLKMVCTMIYHVRNNRHNSKKEREITDEQEQLARLLGLLHDIGHLPFSHTIEDEFGIFKRHDEDFERINLFIGPESRIGIEIKKYGTSLYDKFYKLITIKKNELYKLGEDLFIYEMVNNTACADLLDYLKRDYFHCNLPLGLNYRFLNYMYICNDKIIEEKNTLEGKKEIFHECKRLAIRLWKQNGQPARIDLLEELVSLLEHRYKISRIAYFHHTKIVGGTMIASSLLRAQKKGLIQLSDLYYMGDDELVNFLKKCDNEKSKELAMCYDVRKLWKPVYEKNRKSVEKDQLNDHSNSYLEYIRNTYVDQPGQPSERYETEIEIAEQLGMEDGDILIHCPDFKMQKKYAEMNVFWNGKYQALWECVDEDLIHGKLDLIIKSHEYLWSAQVCMNPEFAKDKIKRQQVKEACEYHFTLKKEQYGTKHYKNIIRNIVSKDSDMASINVLAYEQIELKSLDILLNQTNSDRSFVAIQSIVHGVMKSERINVKDDKGTT